MPNALRIARFPDTRTLADAVASLVATAVSLGVQRHGVATLVFSGGGTPEIFLQQVSRLNLPWNKVTILLTDERWVDEDSPLSNTAMLRRTLLCQPGPAQANFIPFKNAAAHASDGVSSVRASLPPVGQQYDLVLLGMGNDGHVASLFPGTPQLAELLSLTNVERVVAVGPPTTVSPIIERLSMTLAEIRRSERVVLVLKGDTKLDALQRAWQTADAMHSPVFALGDVEVMWCP